MKNTHPILFFVSLFFLLSPAFGQEKMRTRLLTSLCNEEVEQYLERNDIIIVPVGTIETHGGFPLDVEYVAPLACAMKMAEEVDALVLPHLVYFYPGATTVGRGTVYATPSEGKDYLKVIAHSLLRQGFKTQIYLTLHGPAYAYMAPLQMEFLDETKIPILYMDLVTMFSRLETNDLDKLFYGAYDIAGRLEDIPLKVEGVDVPDDFVPVTPAPVMKLLGTNMGNAAVSWYYPTPADHGGFPVEITAKQREEYAKEGIELIDAMLKQADMPGIVQALRELRTYVQEEILPRYGELIPDGPSY